MNRFHLTLAAVLMLAAGASQTIAAVPNTISYQGYLKDANGQPVTSSTELTFRIYDSTLPGATPLWEEIHHNVLPVNGVYDVILNPQLPTALPFDVPYYLELVVNGVVQTPRQPLTSVPYAFRAASADTAVTIADGAVTTAKLADSAVTGLKLADGAVTETKLSPGSVTSGKLSTNSVTFGAILDGAVITPKLADSAVTVPKLADGAVTSPKLAVGAVNTASVATNAITTPAIADGSITAAKLASLLSLNVTDLTLTGILQLPVTTPTTGVIRQGPTTLLHSKGVSSIFVGPNAGGNLTNSGVNNTAIGASALLATTSGYGNTAAGANALQALTKGTGNTAVGYQAGYTQLSANATTTGVNNTFIGTYAGSGISTQINNATAIGYNALVSQSNSLVLGGSGVNVGIGTATPTEILEVAGGNLKVAGTVITGTPIAAANLDLSTVVAKSGGLGGIMTGTLTLPTDGLVVGGNQLIASGGNIGIGTATPGDKLELAGTLRLPATTTTTGVLIRSAMDTLIHTYGDKSFYAGINAGSLTNTGVNNTATGYQSLSAINNGSGNSSFGTGALQNNSSGSSNTALGLNAGFNQTGGSNNVYVGANVVGVAGESDTIRIGNVIPYSSQTRTFIAGIYNTLINTGNPVYVNPDGQLGTLYSSRRFKEEITDMSTGTADLMKLRPVTFYYKPEYAAGSRLLQYGLIAEEVAEVYPGLVQYNDQGEPNSVYYQFLAPMLLNELQKQHHTIEKQQADIERLKGDIAELRQLLGREKAVGNSGIKAK